MNANEVNGWTKESQDGRQACGRLLALDHVISLCGRLSNGPCAPKSWVFVCQCVSAYVCHTGPG